MKKFLLWAMVLGVLAGFGFTALSVVLYRTPGSYAAQEVTLAPGTGVRGTLNQLHAQGLIPAPLLVALPLIVSGEYKALKAGEYAFEVGLSPAQIIHKVVAGEVVVHKLTIVEGWNMRQVRVAFMAEPLLSGELPDQIAEGSIYPDTLHFSRGETRATLVEKLQKMRADKLAEAWEKRAPNLPLSSPREALILASIVEKETGVNDEREKVAGVFINRLRIGMMLQSDPTVVYGIEQKLGRDMGRPLTSADLATDTPYNSYTRAGLTPTPICTPGQSAIEAVLHPASLDALYFVATGHGGHNFAATLKEHEANVAIYRAEIRKNHN